MNSRAAAPGSKGEELTVKYLSSEFGKLGLGPGNPNGTWIQEVPLVGHPLDVRCLRCR